MVSAVEEDAEIETGTDGAEGGRTAEGDNLGKLQFGIEYMLTAVHYGKADAYKHATTDLHWVLNHRVQAIVKFTF